MDGVRFVMTARIPADGVATFQRYEDSVLPLLSDHGGYLEQRLRNDDATREVHVVWFPSREAFHEYLDDSRRTSHAHVLDESRAETDLFEVSK